jgi:hypothetical protein
MLVAGEATSSMKAEQARTSKSAPAGSGASFLEWEEGRLNDGRSSDSWHGTEFALVPSIRIFIIDFATELCFIMDPIGAR